MSNQDQQWLTQTQESRKTNKAPYSTPQLTVYGKVNDLTLGGGGAKNDGGGINTKA